MTYHDLASAPGGGVAASRSKVMIAHKVVATAAPLRFELHIHLVDVSGTNWTTVDALTPSRAHHQVPRGLLAVSRRGPGGCPYRSRYKV